MIALRRVPVPAFMRPPPAPAARADRPVRVGPTGLRMNEGGVMSVLIDTVAWVRVENGRILCARPRGKDVFYIPGGKREGRETDLQTLLREVEEELAVAILPATVSHMGTYEAQAHGHPDGVVVRMSCYAA